MKEEIIRQGTAKEFYIPENCFVAELLNKKDHPDVSIARVKVLPGTSTKVHILKNTEELYFILEGQGEVKLGDNLPETVGAGDLIIIPPECPQCIRNNTNHDLVFLAICIPRFTKEIYRELE